MSEIIEIMKLEFSEAMRKLPAIIDFDFSDEAEEFNGASVEVNLRLEYPEGVVRQNHKITLACYDLDCIDEYGIDCSTEDADVGDITPENIMTQLYFDLGLKDIEDEYLQ